MRPIITPVGAIRAAAIGIALLAVGCHEQKSATPPLSSNVLAVVGGQVITVERFQNELAQRAQAAPGRFAEAEEKQALLEELIGFEASYQKALAAGYDKDPQIIANVKRMIVAKFQAEQMAKPGSPPVTAREIADFYQNNPQRFGTREKLHAALIELKVPQTATAERRAEAASRAEAVLAEARTNASPDRTFGVVAERHSEHQSSRYRGGDIGWLSAGATNTEWPAAVVGALFKLSQPGELSPVVETPTAFYLLKLIERQPATLRPLAEVKEGVEYLVVRQKEQQREKELHATLTQGLNIQINRALLDAIRVPTQELKPPGVPLGPTARAARPAGQRIR